MLKMGENVHLATFGDYVQKFFISALANIKAARTNLQRAAAGEQGERGTGKEQRRGKWGGVAYRNSCHIDTNSGKSSG